jgi:hypothetical protein
MIQTLTLCPQGPATDEVEGEPNYYRLISWELYTHMELDDRVDDPNAPIVLVWNVNYKKVIYEWLGSRHAATIVSRNGLSPLFDDAMFIYKYESSPFFLTKAAF